ncbi:hypothetical protein BG005_010142 [Podila minutissima]|nr:hypothetical protein BG005_010142 [Podila minutissima]
MSIIKPFDALNLKKEDLYGDEVGVVTRPDLAKLLATLVPKEKIHFNTRVMSTMQSDDRVTLQCSDHKLYQGSILIGADGAYSNTRQTLYNSMAEQDILPKSDGEPLGYGFDCAVGVTEPLDDALYPALKEKYCRFEIMLGKDIPYSWWLMTLTDNRVGWIITQDVRSQSSSNGEKRNFKYSDWGPDAALEMCNRVRDYASPIGGTMGDFYDKTPKEAISKVMLEDKMLPFGGQGANMAMLGALDLVNLLFDMESDTQEEITSVFERYHKSRRTASKAAFNTSHQTANLMHGKGIVADVVRYISLNWIPNWMIRWGSDKYNEYRHQVVFLPFVPLRGSLKYKTNKPSPKAIFEKSKELKPLGSALSLSPPLMIYFEQLGLYDQLLKVTKPFGSIRLKKENMAPIGTFEMKESKEEIRKRYGYDVRIVSRPDLVNLLLSLIPAERIHLNTKVLSTEQDEHKVTLQCSDSETYIGSILVGADGAHSSVRQNMYKELSKAGVLPRSDSQPLGYGYDCVVGVTDPLDPLKYPVLKEEFCDFEILLGDKIPYTWWYIPLENNKIGWMITEDIRSKGDDGGRNAKSSEWELDAAVDMCKRVRHLPCIYGGALGDIIDSTPKDLISKVILEDKYFSVWFNRRTVLLGDGANMAIDGAVELVNLLFDIRTDSQEDITEAFKQYHDSRRQAAQIAVKSSNQSGSMMHSKGVIGDIVRHIALNWIPNWLFRIGADKINEYRPQINFLPLVEKRGTLKTRTNQRSRRMALDASTTGVSS